MSRTVLLLAVLVAAIVLTLAGCGGEASQVPQEGHTTHHGSADFASLKVLLTGDSGMSGAATFTRADRGVRVKLNLRGLPRPQASYLAHIHAGTCEDKDHAGHSHHGEAAEHHHNEARGHGEQAWQHSEEHGGVREHEHEGDTADEIEYPLTPVESDAKGRGSSTTVLKDLTFAELFSGEPKYINVHAGGSGDPPQLACANMI